MCTHHHKKAYLTHLPKTCTLAHFFNATTTEKRQFSELPIDESGKCIFHSNNLTWKRAQQFTERFLELLQIMLQEETLKELDFRECQFVGFRWQTHRHLGRESDTHDWHFFP